MVYQKRKKQIEGIREGIDQKNNLDVAEKEKEEAIFAARSRRRYSFIPSFRSSVRFPASISILLQRLL